MTSVAPAAARSRGVCIMGRVDFGTGIGTLTEALAELLGRAYDVSVFDIHRRGRSCPRAVLTSGREIDVTDELSGFGVYFYADVLWNGVRYTEYVPPPTDGFRIAYLAFDSDELPIEWVNILNRDFDQVLFTSAHLIDVAVRSGVRIPIGALPLALDIDNQVAQPYRPCVGRRVRFGTLSSYHPRKGLELLVSSFLKEYGDSDEAELVIHSNIAIGPTAASVRSMVETSGVDNVVISTGNLSAEEKDELLATFDVFVNASQGEGYSIGVREALAHGKCVVATALSAHEPIFAAPGTFRVEMLGRVPAVYPEIDGRQFGYQIAPDPHSMRAAMSQAFEFVRSDEAVVTAPARKLLGAQFGLQSLERSYWSVVDPDSVRLAGERGLSPHVMLPPERRDDVRARAGRFGARIGARKIVIEAHDGGFFSLFNTYLSHLVWSMHDSPQRLVLPDWNAGRLLEKVERPVSYCYSAPRDGNLWNHLFEPPYGLTAEDLDDAEFLSESAEHPRFHHNESREPLLTYIHAFQLYNSPQFARIRRQYHQVIADHVRLRPALQSEIDTFVQKNLEGRFVVAAHVKHPSHAVEQPEGRIAERALYLDLVRQVLAARGIAEGADDWVVFVATEQERVIELFRRELGEHVVTFPEVERIPTEVDQRFDQLDERDRLADGHQLQHIVAADFSRWSPRLAWEVYRDADVMSRADVLFHAVSNVATAASFMGPDVSMRFLAP